MPRRQLTHHENTLQKIEVAADRGFADTQGAGRLRRIPYLAMVMGEHGPEAKQRRCGGGDAKLREVPLQESPDEVVSPRSAVDIVSPFHIEIPACQAGFSI